MWLFLPEWTTLQQALAFIVIVIVTSAVLKAKQDRKDPLKIESCPNPNCVRCRRYAEVNATASSQVAVDHEKTL